MSNNAPTSPIDLDALIPELIWELGLDMPEWASSFDDIRALIERLREAEGEVGRLGNRVIRFEMALRQIGSTAGDRNAPLMRGVARAALAAVDAS